jgi:aspartate carbamoyltransferase catalytic subunit
MQQCLCTQTLSLLHGIVFCNCNCNLYFVHALHVKAAKLNSEKVKTFSKSKFRDSVKDRTGKWDQICTYVGSCSFENSTRYLGYCSFENSSQQSCSFENFIIYLGSCSFENSTRYLGSCSFETSARYLGCLDDLFFRSQKK